MLRRSRFVIAGVIIILVNQVVSFAVSAAMPGAFLPAGSTRYAVARNSTQVTVDSTQGYVAIPGISKSFTIPTGKTGDLMMTVCGEIKSSSGGQVSLRALIGDTVATPGPVRMLAPVGQYASQCFSFFQPNVAGGVSAVQYEWKIETGEAVMQKRTMMIAANIH